MKFFQGSRVTLLVLGVAIWFGLLQAVRSGDHEETNPVDSFFESVNTALWKVEPLANAISTLIFMVLMELLLHWAWLFASGSAVAMYYARRALLMHLPFFVLATYSLNSARQFGRADVIPPSADVLGIVTTVDAEQSVFSLFVYLVVAVSVFTSRMLAGVVWIQFALTGYVLGSLFFALACRWAIIQGVVVSLFPLCWDGRLPFLHDLVKELWLHRTCGGRPCSCDDCCRCCVSSSRDDARDDHDQEEPPAPRPPLRSMSSDESAPPAAFETRQQHRRGGRADRDEREPEEEDLYFDERAPLNA